MSGKGLHIVLIGFMGSGKSTIGKALAKQLNYGFVETDQEVVDAEEMSISQIFEKRGERYFRQVESKVLQSILKSDVPTVISTGGGAPCFCEGIKYILEYGYSFYLKVGRDSLLKRIQGDLSRPLIANKTKSELKQFIDVSLSKREQFYKMANQTIMANDLPGEIVDRITKYLDKKQI